MATPVRSASLQDKSLLPIDRQRTAARIPGFRRRSTMLVKDGKQTTELHAIRQAIGFVKDLYGATLATDFRTVH